MADLKFSDICKEQHQVKHHRFIKDLATLKEFLNAVDSYKNEIVKQALKFAIYTALRSANVRGLKWCYIDFNKNLITIPADKMKMKSPFILPMSKQVVELLEQHRQISKYELVFSLAGKEMSDNTLNKAIKILGFGEEQVFHGLRGLLFSMNLNEPHKEHKQSH